MVVRSVRDLVAHGGGKKKGDVGGFIERFISVLGSLVQDSVDAYEAITPTCSVH